MRFTDKMIDKINNNLTEKKKANPVSHNVIGIGVRLYDSVGDSSAFMNNWQICKVEEISRLIEELTMLKDAIEEEAGVRL